MSTIFEPQLLCKFDLPKDWITCSISIGPEGEIYHLVTKPIPKKDGSFPLVGAEPHLYHCQVWNPIAPFELHLGTSDQVFHSMQCLNQNEYLLVNHRCPRYADGTAKKNGVVVDRDGNVQREILLGDGIEDVQVSEKGLIWCSYFDEGVYGNYGWSGTNEASLPIGKMGLVAFDFNGKQAFEYPLHEGEKGFLWIDDCYAMNTFSDETWICPYSEWPLVQIQNHQVKDWWMTEVSSPSAFAIRDKTVLFALKGKFVLLELLENHATKIISEFEFSTTYQEILGRGQYLYLRSDTSVYRIDIKTL